MKNLLIALISLKCFYAFSNVTENEIVYAEDIGLCSKFDSFPGKMTICKEVTRGNAFYDEKSITQCDRHSDPVLMLQCFEITANVIYTNDISECSEITNAYELNSCLINLGGKKPVLTKDDPWSL